MEFLNIGGGELLILVLLALILFGPEDIIQIMRTVGKYTTNIRRMWTQMSSGLQGELFADEQLPGEVQETVEQAKASVEEVQASLEEVKSSVESSVGEIPKAMEIEETTGAAKRSTRREPVPSDVIKMLAGTDQRERAEDAEDDQGENVTDLSDEAVKEGTALPDNAAPEDEDKRA
jgi:sec-independent protein translocase protein TatA